MPALGLVETLGLLAAIEAADCMLKAADVRLLGKHLATGGLVTITVSGEVAAVKAAVDAAQASTARFQGALVSCHVIARPDTTLDTIVPLSPLEEAHSLQVDHVEPCEDIQTPSGDFAQYTKAQLNKMPMQRLREAALALEELPLAKSTVAQASRKALVDAMLTIYRQREE